MGRPVLSKTNDALRATMCGPAAGYAGWLRLPEALPYYLVSLLTALEAEPQPLAVLDTTQNDINCSAALEGGMPGSSPGATFECAIIYVVLYSYFPGACLYTMSTAPG